MSFQLPVSDLKIQDSSAGKKVFDPLRKKWFLLTPEEFVRQQWIQYLLYNKNFPPALIAIEKEFDLNGLKKRFDILIHNSIHKPAMIIECKSADVLLDEKTAWQALTYNQKFKVQWLVISNGSVTAIYHYQNFENGFTISTNFPEFQLL